MSEQLQLNAEQVIVAIQQLDPIEKKKVQRRHPYLFALSENMRISKADDERLTAQKEPHQYSFFQVRRLLRNVQGSMSSDVIGDREDRF